MGGSCEPDPSLPSGILTKPDLVDRGTESNVLRVAQNLTYCLKKGFLMVRCRGQQDISDGLSLAEANERESKFFQTHLYFRSGSERLARARGQVSVGPEPIWVFLHPVCGVPVRYGVARDWVSVMQGCSARPPPPLNSHL